MIAKVTKCVSIIGPMGAGKTTVGLGLSKALGCDFIDMDKEIEKAQGPKSLGSLEKKVSLVLEEERKYY